MRRCPYCDSALTGPPQREQKRTNSEPGKKNTGAELIYCPDCGGVIDGFSAH